MFGQSVFKDFQSKNNNPFNNVFEGTTVFNGNFFGTNQPEAEPPVQEPPVQEPPVQEPPVQEPPVQDQTDTVSGGVILNVALASNQNINATNTTAYVVMFNTSPVQTDAINFNGYDSKLYLTADDGDYNELSAVATFKNGEKVNGVLERVEGIGEFLSFQIPLDVWLQLNNYKNGFTDEDNFNQNSVNVYDLSQNEGLGVIVNIVGAEVGESFVFFGAGSHDYQKDYFIA